MHPAAPRSGRDGRPLGSVLGWGARRRAWPGPARQAWLHAALTEGRKGRKGAEQQKNMSVRTQHTQAEELCREFFMSF